MKFKYQYLSIIGIIILLYILLNINISKVTAVLSSVNLIYLVLAILINFVIILLLTLRWKFIVLAMNADMKFRTYLLLRLKGAFLGSITPGKIGDFYRAKHLSEETSLSIAQSFSSVIIDRIADVCALIFLGTIGIYVVLNTYNVIMSWFGFIFFSILIIFGMILIIKKKVTKRLLRPFFKIFVPKNSKKKVMMHFNDFYEGVSKIKPSNYFISFILSILIWVTTSIGVYLLALSIDIDISIIYIISIAPLAAVLSALPVSIGGLGTRDAIYIYFLSSIGIESEYAVALSLLVLIFLNLIYIPIGIVLYISPNLGSDIRKKDDYLL